MHHTMRVSERSDRMRVRYSRMDGPDYEYYDEGYAPAPRAGWWEWHPDYDDGPDYRW
jgi:hypothetical protein